MKAMERTQLSLLIVVTLCMVVACDRTPEEQPRAQLLESDLVGNEPETPDRPSEREETPSKRPSGDTKRVSIPLGNMPDGGIKGRIVKSGVVRIPMPENIPEEGVTITLAPPDAGHRTTGAPIRPGDVLPETGPTISPAELDLQRALAREELGTTPCEHSYNILRAIAQQANQALPNHERYIQTCEDHPFMMQRCLDPEYRKENEEECNAVRDNVNPTLLDRFRRVVEGG